MITVKTLQCEADFEKFGISRADYVDFLYKYLDRFRDSKKAINKAVDYAFSKDKGRGGFLLVAFEKNAIVGEFLNIYTGMEKYIPENIFVYIAVDPDKRGMGIGKIILEKAISKCSGDIALHVEHDNPAKRLYERIGFKSKYAEMRYSNKKKCRK